METLTNQFARLRDSNVCFCFKVCCLFYNSHSVDEIKFVNISIKNLKLNYLLTFENTNHLYLKIFSRKEIIKIHENTNNFYSKLLISERNQVKKPILGALSFYKQTKLVHPIRIRDFCWSNKLF